MARSDPQFNLRIPFELKQRIEDAAKSSGRSATAEIVARLDASLSGNAMTEEEQGRAQIAFARGYTKGAIEVLRMNLRDAFAGDLDPKTEKRVMDAIEEQLDDVLRKIDWDKGIVRYK